MFVSSIKILEYNIIDISEGIDTNKTSASKECNICHYWYFLDKKFTYEPYLCTRCHDLMQKAMNFNDVAIVSIKGNNYRIHFWYMSIKDAIVLMTNSNLKDKNRILVYIKEMNKSSYYQKNKDAIINRAKIYYHNNIEFLRKRARKKYRELPEEEKMKKREYAENRYKNLSEEKNKI